MTEPKSSLSNSFIDALGGVSSLAPRDRCAASGLVGSSKAFFLARVFLQTGKNLFVILPEQEGGGASGAAALTRDLRFFLGSEKVLFYPGSEQLPFERQSVHPDISAERLAFLHALATTTAPVVAVASAATLLERVIPRAALLKKTLKLGLGDEIPRDELLLKLFEGGYHRRSMVEERGEVSVRGGIVDIFPPAIKGEIVGADTGGRPLRIEFFGDEVESIRTFDGATQRSLKELAEVLILPAMEADLSAEARNLARGRLLDRADELSLERSAWQPTYDRILDGTDPEGLDSLLPFFYKNLETAFDYLPLETLVATVDPSGAASAIDLFSVEAKARSEESLLYVNELYISADEFAGAVAERAEVRIEPLIGGAPVTGSVPAAFHIETQSNRALRQDILLKKDLSPLAERIRGWLGEGTTVCVTAHNRGQAERTAELIEGFVGGAFETRRIEGPEFMAIAGRAGPDRGPVNICVGVLGAGFHLPTEGVVVVTEEELFGERTRHRPPPSRKLDSFLTDLQDLKPSDAVVHALHGIGLYRGIERVDHAGVAADFLLLEYKDGDKLYLPVQRLDLVTKYHSLEGHEATLDKLGGGGWDKVKGRVRKAVKKIAGELIKLYAERASAKGHAFSAPGHIFTEFEEAFEFEETPDQAVAIEEILSDMGTERPMDRLLCGDVGYGKTEVAMRAAFRAALDGKQVAVLVPTTVLAQQHFLTFTERFAPFPVIVDVLSRFRTAREQREVLKDAAGGKVDILIGTHRIVQKDMAFKDLGLIVVDEEHRFGVRHKERLKELKKEVDVLTLTATPIPRTLQMSFGGLRDLSVINTAPKDRLAVATRIVSFDDALIKEAIEREIKRGGQVFFVHNRVQSIGGMLDYLKSLVPDATVGVAHGQMAERELERVMIGFVKGEFQILLTTTIIESGLDIPTANTIIINRADRFGLAELYQLRGRVGRSHHRAYAYLISPGEGSLTIDAAKRMEVIRELTELGSGFRVAAYDLEIRGAGEMLGSAQSGHISEVGFDLYAQLLEEAVVDMKREMNGEEPTEDAPAAAPEVNLRVSQYIPDDYVPDTRQRLNLYKRLAMAREAGEVEAIEDEMTDRYGPVPEAALNLVDVARLRVALVAIKGVKGTELSEKAGRLYLGFSEVSDDRAATMIALAKDEPGRFRVTPGRRFVYTMDKVGDKGGGKVGEETPKTSPPTSPMTSPMTSIGKTSIEEARYLLKAIARR